MRLQKRYLGFVFWGFLLIAFIVTRIWRLDAIPSGIHADEAGMAYDAWSLAHYGVDRWLKSWPVYMTNMGTGASSLYAFLCAGLLKIFDYNIVVARMPAVLFSFLAFLFCILIARKLYPGNRVLPWMAGLLVTLCPYFILASRIAMDCNLMLGGAALFLYCFSRALSQDRIPGYVLAGVVGGLVLYTYILSYIVLPLFLLMALCYVLRVRKFNILGWTAMAIPMGMLALPLVLVQCVNAFDWPEMQLGVFTITKFVGGYRAAELGMFRLQNLVETLRVVFLGDELNYNTVPGYWNLYGITIPLFVVGFLGSVKRFLGSVRQRQLDMSVMVLLWFLSVLFLGCHISADVHRVNSIFLAYVLIAVEGVDILLKLCRTQVLQRISAGAVICTYLLLFVRFGSYYYGGGYLRDNYPLAYFDITVSEGVQFLEEHPELQNRKTYVAGGEIFLALSMLRSPYELNLYEQDGNFFEYWYCGGLGEPEEYCNYIVWDKYGEYMEELRRLGYGEVPYSDYSLFYFREQ